MKFAIIFSVIIAVSHAATFMDTILSEWNLFKIEHQKSYGEVEDKQRLKNFINNRYLIAKHNQKYERGLSSYKLDLNKFADMTLAEMKAIWNGFKPSMATALTEKATKYSQPQNVKIPKSFDWRSVGAVTPIKDQGQCGSCWAFSATGSLEGLEFVKTGKLVSLSEQNLIDCSRPEGNEGCEGGLPKLAFQYVYDNGGIDSEASYPYQAVDGSCQFNRTNVAATDRGYVNVEEGNEDALKSAVATVGPISIGIDANHHSFFFYKEGIFYEPDCSSTELDHGVLAVGYGTNSQGVDYWIVKNSWGTEWGINGYVHMARNRENNCGVASCATYPLV